MDIFSFSLTKGGFVPNGSEIGGDFGFSGYCKDKSLALSGLGCAAWVIYNENMDYLHCSDLACGVKTKCD